MIENKGKDYQEVTQYNYNVPKHVSKIEAIIYDYVANHYGTNEACNPSWNINQLSEYVENNINNENYKQEHTVAYDD
jgi:hypothetical protein